MTPPREPARYQHEVYYTRWWAYLALCAGFAALLAASICALWLRSWPLPLALVGAGLVLLASAYEGLRESGPRVKFGPEGIWTANLGFESWQQVRADVSTLPGAPLSTSISPTAYVLVYDRKTSKLLDQIEALPLDMELDLLGGHLRYYSKLAKKR